MLNTANAVKSAKSSLLRLLSASAKEGNFQAAQYALRSLEDLRAIEPLFRQDADFDRWKITEPERNLIRGGNFINAIKEIRNRTKLGLKEAKDLADAYREYLYHRRARWSARQSSRGRRARPSA